MKPATIARFTTHLELRESIARAAASLYLGLCRQLLLGEAVEAGAGGRWKGAGSSHHASTGGGHGLDPGPARLRLLGKAAEAVAGGRWMDAGFPHCVTTAAAGGRRGPDTEPARPTLLLGEMEDAASLLRTLLPSFGLAQSASLLRLLAARLAHQHHEDDGGAKWGGPGIRRGSGRDRWGHRIPPAPARWLPSATATERLHQQRQLALELRSHLSHLLYAGSDTAGSHVTAAAAAATCGPGGGSGGSGAGLDVQDIVELTAALALPTTPHARVEEGASSELQRHRALIASRSQVDSGAAMGTIGVAGCNDSEGRRRLAEGRGECPPSPPSPPSLAQLLCNLLVGEEGDSDDAVVVATLAQLGACLVNLSRSRACDEVALLLLRRRLQRRVHRASPAEVAALLRALVDAGAVQQAGGVEAGRRSTADSGGGGRRKGHRGGHGVEAADFNRGAVKQGQRAELSEGQRGALTSGRRVLSSALMHGRMLGTVARMLRDGAADLTARQASLIPCPES